MWTLFFGVDSVSNFTDAARADAKAYAHFFHGMIERGFYLPPAQFEAAFLSLAHTESDVDEAADAADDVLSAR